MKLIQKIRLALDKRWPVHGKGTWKDMGLLEYPCADNGHLMLCSECGMGFCGRRLRYCPFCGAKMSPNDEDDGCAPEEG